MSRTRTALALGVGNTTILELLNRYETSGMPLEAALKLSDDDLERHLFPVVSGPLKRCDFEPDVSQLLSELNRPGVTMQSPVQYPTMQSS